jgi:sterol desaturase/sphingolipid hydroxylase (fatty acid hydroxylase superfamily)
LVFSYLVEWIDTLTHIRAEMILADVPVWLLLFISLIVHDFYIYWFHKAQHLNNYLWRIHEAHHSTTDMDWLSGSRSHAFEILINQTIEFGFLILLGAPPEVIVLKGAISAVWGMWIHANVDVNTGKLQYIINGPEMHRWHHVDKDPEAFHKNYATKFAFWDWMFGTAYLNREKKLKYYGISNPFPENYFGQFIALFRKFDFEKEILIDKKTGKHNKSLSS